MIKKYIFRFFELIFIGLLVLLYQNALATNTFRVEKIHFSSPQNVQKEISSLPNSEVVTVSFGFDPYNSKMLEIYLPDGYITVNGEYDMTELVAKGFFYPILENNDIKFLIIDLNPLIKNPTPQKLTNIKMLIEKLASYLNTQGQPIGLGLKFKYDKNSRESIDKLFAFIQTQIYIKALYIESNYNDFFVHRANQNYLKNIKYLNLESNIIGAQKSDFENFLTDMDCLKNLEILDLNNNAIGSLNGNLILFGNKLASLKKLKYVNLENNLIGANQEDTKNFLNYVHQFKRVNVNLNYNLN